MKPTRRIFATLAALLLGGGIAMPARAADPAEITFLLPSPRFLVAFAPLNLAEQRGYFATAGVHVNFVAARGGAEVATQVGAGNALMGDAIGDTPIIVRANGVPIRAVAILGGGALTTVVAREEGPITSLAALKGHALGVQSFQDTTYYAALGALSTVGLSQSDVNIQALGPAGIWQLFIAGKTDAMSAVPDWIVEAEAAGIKIRQLSSVETFPSMAQALVVSDSGMAAHPKEIRAVVQATIHAMNDIIADPDAAARDIIAFSAKNGYPVNSARVLPTLKLYAKMVYAGQKIPGAADPARISRVQDFYLKAGIIPHATPVKDLYSNDFLAQ